MNRFFVPPENIQGTAVSFPQETAAQIRNVLRLKAGSVVQVLDNSGGAWQVTLSQVSAQAVNGEIENSLQLSSEPRCRVTLCLPLTRREKFEWMLQKCTECGVSAFQPYLSERTLIHDSHDFQNRQIRWNKIIQEAAEQSGRAKLPELLTPLPFQRLLQSFPPQWQRLFFWEAEGQHSLHATVSALSTMPEGISLIVGPEGGFSENEAENAAHCGWQLLTLGKRILRMETAAVAAVLLVNYELEQREI